MGKTKQPPDLEPHGDIDGYKALVEDWYLDSEPSFLADLELEPSKFLLWKDIQRLSRYLAEFLIYMMVIASNTTRGFAPSTPFIEAMHHKFIPTALPGSIKTSLRECFLNRGWQRKKWFYNMRLRWYVKHGKLMPIKGIPVPVMLEKTNAFRQLTHKALTANLEGKPVALVCLDESSVKYGYNGQQGWVFSKKCCPIATGEQGEPDVPELNRGTMTYIGMISPDPAVQQLLPQILLANNRKVTVGVQKKLMGQLPDSVKLWVRKSSWVNAAIAREILSLLKTILAGWVIVLVWDCCPAHLQDHVIALARRFKIRLPLVPARLTWLLSPCDLMLFLKVKRQIKLEWQKEVFAQGSNNLDCGTWVLLVSRAIHDVIHCSWDKAFRLAGITTTGVIPSASIEKHLGMSKLDPISPDMPTASSLSCILPRNRKLDMGRLLWWNAAPDRAQSAIPDLVALAREARTLD